MDFKEKNSNLKDCEKPVISDLKLKLTQSAKAFEGLNFEKNDLGGEGGDRHPS